MEESKERKKEGLGKEKKSKTGWRATKTHVRTNAQQLNNAATVA